MLPSLLDNILPVKRSLSAVIIAKNEARSIARCIESVVHIVDRVVMLDTGSSDDTVNIARKSGAEVFEGAWHDDFSLARNTVLELADADWNLVIDADEWVQSGAECLRSVIERNPVLGIVSIQSRYDTQAVGAPLAVSSSWITRLLPHGVLYEGRIHEQPHSNLPRIRLPLILGHDGYTKIQLEQKVGRNRKLIKLELAQFPYDSYLLYQFGKDCEISREFFEACGYYQQSLLNIPENALYRHDLLVRLLYCLSQTKQYEEAIRVSNNVMAEMSESPDFFFVYGNLLLDCAVYQPQEALSTWLPLAEMAWLRCLEIGERPDLDGSVSGRGSHLAAYNLSVIYEGCGDAEKASLYRLYASEIGK